jgi:hypothetical protein
VSSGPTFASTDEFMIFDAVGHRVVAYFEEDESKLVLRIADDVRHEADLRERLPRYLDVVGRTPDRSLPFREFTVACARVYLEGERELRSRRRWRRG